MARTRKPTDWPEGFEAYTRAHRFTDLEELLLWDCSLMHECFEEALARWKDREGWVNASEMRSDEWKMVRIMADEIALERHGRPLSMRAIRWGCRLAERLEWRFLRESYPRIQVRHQGSMALKTIWGKFSHQMPGRQN